MKIVKETVEELKTLSRSQIIVVHDLIASMKRANRPRRPALSSRSAYRRAQKAFRAYKGSLAEDITRDREDRV